MHHCPSPATEPTQIHGRHRPRCQARILRLVQLSSAVEPWVPLHHHRVTTVACSSNHVICAHNDLSNAQRSHLLLLSVTAHCSAGLKPFSTTLLRRFWTDLPFSPQVFARVVCLARVASLHRLRRRIAPPSAHFTIRVESCYLQQKMLTQDNKADRVLQHGHACMLVQALAGLLLRSQQPLSPKHSLGSHTRLPNSLAENIYQLISSMTHASRLMFTNHSTPALESTVAVRHEMQRPSCQHHTLIVQCRIGCAIAAANASESQLH